MVHEAFVLWVLCILFKFVKSLIRHLGLAIGNVWHVWWFSWNLRNTTNVNLYSDITWASWGLISPATCFVLQLGMYSESMLNLIVSIVEYTTCQKTTYAIVFAFSNKSNLAISWYVFCTTYYNPCSNHIVILWQSIRSYGSSVHPSSRVILPNLEMDTSGGNIRDGEMNWHGMRWQFYGRFHF